MTILAFAIQALSSLPDLIDAGVDVYDLINKTNDSIKKMQEDGRDPTPEEWDALNAVIEDLRSQRPDVGE